jgi:single-stranded-DNA-specific exonuclease
VTLSVTCLERFRRAFDDTVRELLTPADLLQTIETDGALAPTELTLDLAENFAGMVWGQGFPPPRFHGRFRVAEQRLTSGGHLKLRVALAAGQRVAPFDGMVFGQTGPLAETVRAVYRLEPNEWNGTRAVQLVVEHWEPAPPASH